MTGVQTPRQSAMVATCAAWGGPLDGFAASAPVTLPANGVIVLTPD